MTNNKKHKLYDFLEPVGYVVTLLFWLAGSVCLGLEITTPGCILLGLSILAALGTGFTMVLDARLYGKQLEGKEPW